MLISQISKQDLANVAQLVKAMRVAKFPDMSMDDAAALSQVREFIGRFSKNLADTYQAESTPVLPPEALKPSEKVLMNPKTIGKQSRGKK